MNVNEFVSVVIPCFKAERFIVRAVSSLLKSGVSQENICLVEDGVFDRTKDVVSVYPDINFISYETNKGAPYARNVGLERVSKKYVMFIDSDDFVSEELIKGLVAEAENNASDLVFGPWRFDGEKAKTKKINYPSRFGAKQWVTRWLTDEYVPPCSVLWSTSLAKKIGGWDERLRQNQDGDIAIRGLMKTDKIAFSNTGFSTYWQHGSDVRVSNAKLEHKELSSDIIYNNVNDWIVDVGAGKESSADLARFCIAQAWRYSELGDEYSEKWLSRAELLGVQMKGYNVNTNLLSFFLGFKASSKIRNAFKKRKKIFN